MLDALRSLSREKGARPPGAFLADCLRDPNAQRLDPARARIARRAAQRLPV